MKIPFRNTRDRFGHKFFPVTSSDDGEFNLELTYDKDLKVRNFYIHRTLVTGDLVSTFADFYDNDQMEDDICAAEMAPAELYEFQRDHRPDTPQEIAS